MKTSEKKQIIEEEIEPKVEQQKETELPKKAIRIPRLHFPTAITHTQVLIGILVVFSFALGYLFNQVRYLEKAVQTAQIAGTQAAAQPAAQAQAIPSGPPQKVNVDVGHFPVKGDTNAKVTVIEFADMRCPFCEKFYTETEPQLLKDYVDTGKIKFYFRSYAFLGPASLVASNAIECANEQGKFWDMHDYLYKNQPSESDTSMYTTDNLATIAGQLSMDTNQFKTCLDGKKYDKNVQDDISAATAAGVSGTPTLIINGTPIVGAQPYSAFQAAIDAALKG